MHSALLIDEILQLIFDYCWTCGHEPRRTFALLARCCKAWKDPALDRVWARMITVEPLLALLPKEGQHEVSTTNRSPSFPLYAARVKQISHHTSLRHVPVLSWPFPRLEALALSFDGCMAPQAWTNSPVLKRVSINVGYTHASQATLDRSNAAAAYLQTLRLCAPNLQSLQLRGRMTDALNSAVASFTHLQNLTVQGYHFLSCKTFTAIATFPSLRSLDVHASHIDSTEFEAALTSVSPSASCFPTLNDLTIRTNGSLLASILARIPGGTLTKLHADMDKCLFGSSYMKPIFDVLVQKTSASLHELTIEDRTDFEEVDASLHTRDATRWYTLDVLSPLAGLKRLRRFTINQPDLHDAEFAQLAKWWPALEYLNLGTLDADVDLPEWKVCLTPAAYAVVAKALPRLVSLSLPAYPRDAKPGPPTHETGNVPDKLEQKSLRCLTVGDLPAAGAVEAVDTLLAIFPSLVTLECPTTEVTERFDAVLSGGRAKD